MSQDSSTTPGSTTGDPGTTPAGTTTGAPAGVTDPAAATVPAVPESYAFKFPDGTLLDSAGATQRVTERLKALKVTDPALAQAFVDTAHGELSEYAQVFAKAHEPGGAAHAALIERLTAESLAAQDLGNGDPVALERKQLAADMVLNRYAPAAAKSFDDLGLRRHPDVLRLLNAVYEATKERGSPDPSGTVTPTAADPYKALFPTGLPDPDKVAVP